MKKLKRILSVGAIFGILFSCADEVKNTSIETDEIEFAKEGELFLLKAGDTLQKLDIEFAETSYEQQTGLMYRKSMQENQAMLFVYPEETMHSFYMKNTYIPLDLVFFGKDSTIVSFQENATPLDETSLPSKVPAQFILEVNAGKVEQWNLAEGDKMAISRN
ncbi:hypothetical protein JM83_0630 [Gillisia sp. Hel_I_86]|uniref:DUF192 domain-containing protein n=1 Tax=Gillisia sp. Hel_I_86 TaxID=1249981 RepID=UPI00119A6097|nr:DUF192 domain-containing protein [Gillisia sp. Hel_I_86]TVZ25701.1 hypothetical protein JM83_0630 [Gillisia sp. Hel_I_86]